MDLQGSMCRERVGTIDLQGSSPRLEIYVDELKSKNTLRGAFVSFGVLTNYNFL